MKEIIKNYDVVFNKMYKNARLGLKASKSERDKMVFSQILKNTRRMQSAVFMLKLWQAVLEENIED